VNTELWFTQHSTLATIISTSPRSSLRGTRLGRRTIRAFAPYSCCQERLGFGSRLSAGMPQQATKFRRYTDRLCKQSSRLSCGRIARNVLRTDDGRRDGQGSQLDCAAWRPGVVLEYTP
jgi:hypothetical protein